MTRTNKRGIDRVTVDFVRFTAALDGGEPIGASLFDLILLSIFVKAGRNRIQTTGVVEELSKREYDRKDSSVSPAVSCLKSRVLDRLGIRGWLQGSPKAGYTFFPPELEVAKEERTPEPEDPVEPEPEPEPDVWAGLTLVNGKNSEPEESHPLLAPQDGPGWTPAREAWAVRKYLDDWTPDDIAEELGGTLTKSDVLKMLRERRDRGLLRPRSKREEAQPYGDIAQGRNHMATADE